ncbi:MAG: TlyA family RNA methyltransferase [Acidimicrobiia bacterium]
MRRRLDTELVRRGLLSSQTRAQEVIKAGLVTVAGAPATKPDRMVAPDEDLVVHGAGPRFISRAGDKLDRALDAFAVSVAGRSVLDVGASTGGFTDCVLQRGAASVVAVDVGRGQLHWQLRNDERVVSRERTDARALDAETVGAPVDVIVIDVSFISLALIISAVVPFLALDGDVVALVKPQFEAGRESVGRGGIVRDPAVHRSVLIEVCHAFAACGLPVRAVIPSPIRGAEGNVEFLVHARRDALALDDAAIEVAIATAPGERE